jgi:hypothetical protein
VSNEQTTTRADRHAPCRCLNRDHIQCRRNGIVIAKSSRRPGECYKGRDRCSLGLRTKSILEVVHSSAASSRLSVGHFCPAGCGKHLRAVLRLDKFGPVPMRVIPVSFLFALLLLCGCATGAQPGTSRDPNPPPSGLAGLGADSGAVMREIGHAASTPTQ